MIEILTGSEFKNAAKALRLRSAKCTYSRKNYDEYATGYQVWEMTEDDFEILQDADWHDAWGWWRYAKGCNLGEPNATYTINGRDVKAWDVMRLNYARDFCSMCEDADHGSCNQTDQEISLCYGKREAPNLISYLSNEIGASTEKNVCAIAVGMAKANDMALAELFTKLLG